MRFFDDLPPAKQIERWENVLRVLKDLSPHERRRHWDMSTFGEKTSCGTVACAAGHCGMDPWFTRRGFKMKIVKDLFGEEITNLGDDGGEMVENFFGYDGCVQIFFDGTKRPVGVVIQEVKAFIAELREYARG